MNIKTFLPRLIDERVAFISAIFLLILIIVSFIAPFIVPHDPFKQDLMKVMLGPSSQHWLGTDELGRDIFSRLLMGGKAAIQAGLVAIIIPVFIGVPLGIISGYFGGVIDDIFMRIVDSILAIPAILLALGITGALGISLWNAMIAVGIVFTPQFARLARGQTLQVRTEPYIEAAQISGAGVFWITLKHIIPNISPPIIVQASFNISYAILVESMLSFLGLGAQSPQISWGNMIQQAYSMININSTMIIYPGLAIVFTVLAGNFLGDGLRVALDPTYKKY